MLIVDLDKDDCVMLVTVKDCRKAYTRDQLLRFLNAERPAAAKPAVAVVERSGGGKRGSSKLHSLSYAVKRMRAHKHRQGVQDELREMLAGFADRDMPEYPQSMVASMLQAECENPAVSDDLRRSIRVFLRRFPQLTRAHRPRHKQKPLLPATAPALVAANP